jgi:hypothetical protein
MEAILQQIVGVCCEFEIFFFFCSHDKRFSNAQPRQTQSER